MDMLTAAEAAELLHLHPKHVQRMARAGRLPATRVGRKWLFPRHQLEAWLARGAGPVLASDDTVVLSARNQLRVRVAGIAVDGLMAEVRLRIGDQELVSLITRSSAERLRLTVGDEVYAIVKATEVMIGRR